MAAADNPTELLPILSDDRGFDVAIRGYDRTQVEHYLARLDEEMRAVANDRDMIASRSADLAAQLASSQAQIESLRRQLSAASESLTADNVDERVRQMIVNATAEATAIRAAAESEAAATRAAAEERFRSGIGDVEEHRTEVEALLATQTAAAAETAQRLVAEATAEAARLEQESAAERARLDAEAKDRRTLANEDFEITLRSRRSSEVEASAKLQAAARADAEKIINQANERAEALVAEARIELERLHATRERLHQQLVGLHENLGSAIAEHVPHGTAPAEPHTEMTQPADQ